MSAERPVAAPATSFVTPAAEPRDPRRAIALDDDASPPPAPASRAEGDLLRHPALMPGSPAVDRQAATRVPVRLHAPTGSQSLPDPLPPATYHVERGRRRAIQLLGVGVAGLGLAVAGGSTTLATTQGPRHTAEAFLTAAPAILLLISALLLVRASHRVRLVIRDEGIVYHGFVSVLTTTWADAGHLSPVGRGIFEGTGIVLTAPAHVRSPRLFLRVGLAASPDFVPLAPFTEQLAGSSLEADLRRRCPRLFRTPPPLPHRR